MDMAVVYIWSAYKGYYGIDDLPGLLGDPGVVRAFHFQSLQHVFPEGRKEGVLM